MSQGVNGLGTGSMPGRRRRRREAVVALTVAVLAGAACSDDGDKQSGGAETTDASSGTIAATTATAAESTTPGSAAETTAAPSTTGTSTPAATYAQNPCPSPNYPGVPQLDLGPDFTCGTLTVPEDRSDASSATITIPVAIAKAQSPDPQPDPILYLAGGPGGTGLVTAVQRVADGWNRDRDVVFIDQRGTYHAEPRLSCPEIDMFAVESLAFAATAPEAGPKSAAATKACRDRLAADGWDLPAFDTLENAADIADLRVALGIDEWNVYGVSYGSDLALQLLRDHPEGIRSVIVDSVVPPQRNLIGAFWPSAAQGYGALFAACAAQPDCQAVFPDLEQEFRGLVVELAASPRTITIPDPAGGADLSVVVDGYALANTVVVASLRPGAIAEVPAMIHDLATGGGTKIATTMAGGVPPVDVTGYGLTFGVFCGEQVAATTAADVKVQAEAALPDFPADVLSLTPQAAHIFGDCGAWDVPRVDGPVRDATTSDVPTLLLTGDLDAITPPSGADLAAETLSDSTVLRFPGAGHDVMIWSAACAVDVMYAFLDANGGDFDHSCVDTLQAPPFATS
ncbi:MAG: alpha/beta fold hydrolase [Ilumatobacteraceae bacterium]